MEDTWTWASAETRDRCTPKESTGHGRALASSSSYTRRRPRNPLTNIMERKRQRAAAEGKRRLVEARKQHDEGEKKSERTRFAKDHKKRPR